jgi:beta-phosphoglucomutase-like phosphatase (HAD superfamily)
MGRRPAVIVDMDGTLCDVSTVVHLQAEPDGFSAFHYGCAECPPRGSVVDWCVDHYSRGHAILIVTGRDAWTRELTTRWLTEHLPVPIGGLDMRPDGDFRSNVDIKREIHDRLALTYDIRAAIDDDPEIVGLWQAIGIPVAMVLDWGEIVIGPGLDSSELPVR